jgi:hypothetical protein
VKRAGIESNLELNSQTIRKIGCGPDNLTEKKETLELKHVNKLAQLVTALALPT